jgi:hypothetical protein
MGRPNVVTLQPSMFSILRIDFRVVRPTAVAAVPPPPGATFEAAVPPAAPRPPAARPAPPQLREPVCTDSQTPTNYANRKPVAVAPDSSYCSDRQGRVGRSSLRHVDRSRGNCYRSEIADGVRYSKTTELRRRGFRTRFFEE